MSATTTTTTTRMPDEELKKAFTELQEKMMEAEQRFKEWAVQIESLTRTKQRAELTIKEMANLKADTKMYESVGRMFLLNDASAIKSDLEAKIRWSDGVVDDLKESKAVVQNVIREREEFLRAMVQQKQGKETTCG